ncbi:trk system potassium uptake protein TrkH [Tamilnaduibacter salinus]|uniref:Trk system potassium uptake protein n=1 Tax=Tamilnaduibacter salinus TaxID=1484056 RepID=A0A2A2I4F5_9GAMM|nr:TrkH family potassium uptake protein [Tamilnaduibacter salinus]PAV26891.1 potassium transporter [Tamilnaduibacter salinus]PVY77455.1 trk system potassium uptake protein TrkH [Tamilnaduibacter salinus]
MRTPVILKILGILMMLFSITMLPPLGISLLYEDGQWTRFANGMAIIAIGGLLIWAPFRRIRGDLRVRDGFVVTTLFWVVLSVAGSVPLYLSGNPPHTFIDALFEAVSGLTTTGSTVITGIDDLPKSILWYRQQLQWLGGMGIIVLAVAILPMLGIGGMQLYRAEVPGPVKDNKLTPRIAETAKALWYIYVLLTGVCAVAYWLAGMTWFDAIGHSFSTIAIGGFSTHDASIGYFNSAAIEMIAVVFMLLSGANYALHFMAWRQRNLALYLADSEFKFYISALAIISTITITTLIATETLGPFEAITQGLFEVVSLATTTGFGTADFSVWPLMLPFMLFTMSFMGGCAASTGGGIKVVRILLIFRQGAREMKRLLHPNAVMPVKLGNRPVSDRVLQAVWGFFSVYMFMFLIMLVILQATGLDQVTAWTAVGATINNLGPGLGEVAYHYGDIPDLAKWVLCFAMLLGRLEVFTLLLLFTPAFWRR